MFTFITYSFFFSSTFDLVHNWGPFCFVLCSFPCTQHFYPRTGVLVVQTDTCTGFDSYVGVPLLLLPSPPGTFDISDINGKQC